MPRAGVLLPLSSADESLWSVVAASDGPLAPSMAAVPRVAATPRRRRFGARALSSSSPPSAPESGLASAAARPACAERRSSVNHLLRPARILARSFETEVAASRAVAPASAFSAVTVTTAMSTSSSLMVKGRARAPRGLVRRAGERVFPAAVPAAGVAAAPPSANGARLEPAATPVLGTVTADKDLVALRDGSPAAADAAPDERVVRMAGEAASAGSMSPSRRDRGASDRVSAPSETMMTISTAADQNKAAPERVSGRRRFTTKATAVEAVTAAGAGSDCGALERETFGRAVVPEARLGPCWAARRARGESVGRGSQTSGGKLPSFRVLPTAFKVSPAVASSAGTWALEVVLIGARWGSRREARIAREDRTGGVAPASGGTLPSSCLLLTAAAPSIAVATFAAASSPPAGAEPRPPAITSPATSSPPAVAVPPSVAAESEAALTPRAAAVPPWALPGSPAASSPPAAAVPPSARLRACRSRRRPLAAVKSRVTLDVVVGGGGVGCQVHRHGVTTEIRSSVDRGCRSRRHATIRRVLGAATVSSRADRAVGRHVAAALYTRSRWLREICVAGWRATSLSNAAT